MAKPPELRVEEATAFSTEFEDLAPKLTRPGLVRASASYKALMQRVHHLGSLPLELVFFSGLFAGFKVDAIRRAQAQGYKPPLDGPIAWQYQKQAWQQWRYGDRRTEPALTAEVRNVGASNLAGMIEHSEQAIIEGVEAIFASMMSDAWSAFEILAGDLWIEAVNACPSILADRASRDKQVSLKKLSEYNYDLSENMGQFIVDTGRVDFISLRNIQAAYASIFDTEDEKPSTTLFQPFGKIDAVGQVRHCFAHRGGVVDRRGLKAIRRLDAFRDISAGDRIRLTGPIVRDCIDTTLTCSIGLFHYVDDWLGAHENECRTRRDRRAGESA